MEKEILQEIEFLKLHIPKIKSVQTRKQQIKHLHRLMKQIEIYRRYKSLYEKSNSTR